MTTSAVVATGRGPTKLRARLDLADAADTVASTYSGGMVRRLDLTMTLVSRPQVVFLDEPTTGCSRRRLGARRGARRGGDDHAADHASLVEA